MLPAARHLESESIWYSRATRDQRHGPGACRPPLVLVDVLLLAWMHASSPLRPEGRTAAETNNHLVSGYGQHFAVAVSLATGPSPMGARHATELLSSTAQRARGPQRQHSEARSSAALVRLWIGVPAVRGGEKEGETMRDSASLDHGTMASQPVSPGKAQAGTDDRYNAGLTDTPTAQ